MDGPLPVLAALRRGNPFRYVMVGNVVTNTVTTAPGEALIFGGSANHIHGLIELRTDATIAELLRKVKSLSTGWVHKTFPKRGDFFWQQGYAAFSVSRSSAARVIQYIQNQAEHHRRRTFEEEFIALLDRHGVKYDPEHVWD